MATALQSLFAPHQQWLSPSQGPAGLTIPLPPPTAPITQLPVPGTMSPQLGDSPAGGTWKHLALLPIDAIDLSGAALMRSRCSSMGGVVAPGLGAEGTV